VRLYPERRRGLYVLIQVWPTKRDLVRYSRESNHRIGRDGIALCNQLTIINYGRARRPRMLPIFAEVNFWRKRIGMEVITHELFHATLAWARRIKFPWDRLHAEDSVNAEEERLTHVHGRLCSQLVSRFIAVGVYRREDLMAEGAG
jgi:hypothetical protein